MPKHQLQQHGNGYGGGEAFHDISFDHGDGASVPNVTQPVQPWRRHDVAEDAYEDATDDDQPASFDDDDDGGDD
jgi:hypothetical protein